MGVAEDEEEVVDAVEVVNVGDVEENAEVIEAVEVRDAAEVVLLGVLLVVEASPLMIENTDPLMEVAAIAKATQITTKEASRDDRILDSFRNQSGLRWDW